MFQISSSAAAYIEPSYFSLWFLPDVPRQTLLQVADDFIDQVISSACKLAKLRQASQLDIRDLQIILERNYNIRVPGYASDELRTVKKIQPTQAWTQKLSAVQVCVFADLLRSSTYRKNHRSSRWSSVASMTPSMCSC